ncbi:hypothetical protein CK203_024578 [Vitis vinifera]|uniref:Uncharacterized protein n=1 Tax=Vitis vinifera TaxID=29760 RepID=A0A438IUD6_VITVI|nr:hypothetical protein CK203_024578 [Vitis vinifera]
MLLMILLLIEKLQLGNVKAKSYDSQLGFLMVNTAMTGATRPTNSTKETTEEV